METIIFAIGAVVVLGIVAFFVLKKLQTQKIKLPTTPKLNLPSKQDKQDKQDTAPVVPTPAVASNDLSVAEAHINNQNYHEAISELKRVLMINPRHGGALLKLLQTYGITKQYHAFNQLHQKIHEIADGETIREADFCKSLLEEELTGLVAPTVPSQSASTPITQTVAETAVASEPILDKGLDFEFESSAPSALDSTVITPSHEVNDDSNIFDFNFDVNSDASATNETTNSQSQQVDVDFNTLHQPEVQTLVLQPTTEPTLDFDDLSFDEPSSSPAIHDESAAAFDLLSDEISQELSSEQRVESSSDLDDILDLNDDLSNEFDLDFSSDSELTTQKTNELRFDTPSISTASEPISDLTTDLSSNATHKSDGGLDFNLEVDAESIATSESISTSSAPSQSDELESDDLVFDELKFDDDLLNVSPAQSPSESASTPTAELNDVDFDKLEIADHKLDNFDFTSDDSTLHADSHSSPSLIADTDRTDSNDDFDFDDFDTSLDLSDTTTAHTKSEPNTQTTDLEIGSDTGLTLDSDPTLMSLESNVVDGLAFNELDLQLTDLDTADAKASSLEADDFTLDDFEADIEFKSPTEVTFDTTDITLEDKPLDIKPDIQTSLDEFSFMDTPATESVFTSDSDPLQEMPIAPIQTATSSEIGFTDGLYNTDVTLNLAKQYLDLGEYDSAKRLLNEVIQTGDANQQQHARKLISQIA